jgi:hypothetical protein
MAIRLTMRFIPVIDSHSDSHDWGLGALGKPGLSFARGERLSLGKAGGCQGGVSLRSLSV